MSESYYHAANYLFTNLGRLYLCGFNLKTLVLDQVLERLFKYVGHGFCYESAALIMLALKGNRTARLIQGLATGGTVEQPIRCKHAWVEFRYHGVWYVADLCWLSIAIVPRYWFYHDPTPNFQPVPQWVCSYDEFWRIPNSRVFYRKLSQPSTSHLFIELIATYRLTTRIEYSPVHGILTPQDYGFPNCFLLDVSRPSCGNSTIPISYQPNHNVAVTQRIICEFAARPQRLRPKAHSLRHGLTLAETWLQHHAPAAS